jgi:hypothetical protein
VQLTQIKKQSAQTDYIRLRCLADANSSDGRISSTTRAGFRPRHPTRKGFFMNRNDAVVAVFSGHHGAEAAVRSLGDAGLDIKHFSIVGKGYHTEENVIGFYNAGDRVRFWGKNGVIWGGLWGLFFGGVFMSIPLVGPVMVLGQLAAGVFAAIEGAVVVGGLSARGAAIYSLGIPENSVLRYEEALKADSFLLIAHGPVLEMTRAQTVLKTFNPEHLDVYRDVKAMAEPPADHSVRLAAAQ